MTDWRQVLEHQNMNIANYQRQLAELEHRLKNATELRDRALQELRNEEVK